MYRLTHVLCRLLLCLLCAAACPRNTRWVVVTNGDNDYDPKFLSVLVQQQAAEVVAFDYYSRYQRPTGGPWPSVWHGTLGFC
jgi:hypothetical protein